ncbi:Monodehydroascorbate reductase (NADH) protein, partial [Dioscorea alata]
QDGNSSVLIFHSKDTWNSKWQTLKTSNKLHVVINFSAFWCPLCHFMEPIFKEYSEKFTNVIFVKIDVDKLTDVAREWRVEPMPTFVFVKEGKEEDRLLGADKDGLKERIMKFRV